MRVQPHFQDTGGFFIAVLEKKDWLPWQSKMKQKRTKRNTTSPSSENIKMEVEDMSVRTSQSGAESLADMDVGMETNSERGPEVVGGGEGEDREGEEGGEGMEGGEEGKGVNGEGGGKEGEEGEKKEGEGKGEGMEGGEEGERKEGEGEGMGGGEGKEPCVDGGQDADVTMNEEGGSTEKDKVSTAGAGETDERPTAKILGK